MSAAWAQRCPRHRAMRRSPQNRRSSSIATWSNSSSTWSARSGASSRYELRKREVGARDEGCGEAAVAARSSSFREQIKSMLESCGGLQRLDEAVYELLAHVETSVEGGLQSNWFCIGCDPKTREERRCLLTGLSVPGRLPHLEGSSRYSQRRSHAPKGSAARRTRRACGEW
jgi:hypothetical protein